MPVAPHWIAVALVVSPADNIWSGISAVTLWFVSRIRIHALMRWSAGSSSVSSARQVPTGAPTNSDSRRGRGYGVSRPTASRGDSLISWPDLIRLQPDCFKRSQKRDPWGPDGNVPVVQQEHDNSGVTSVPLGVEPVSTNSVGVTQGPPRCPCGGRSLPFIPRLRARRSRLSAAVRRRR